MKKIWIVVQIDCYEENGDGFQRNYAGLKVCHTEAEVDEEIIRINGGYCQEYEIEEVEIEV